MRAVTLSRNLSFSHVLGAVGIVLLGTLPSAAASLYVDGGNALCSDAGSGTASIPFCTIGKGATVAVAGDTVLVSSGTYPEYVKVAHSGTAATPITIRAADFANVIVSGQLRGFEISTKSWITIGGFTVSNTASYGIYVNNSSNITISGNHVTTAGLPVAGSTQPGIYVNSTSDSTVAGNTTDHNTDAGILVTNGSTRVTVVGNISSFNARGYTRAAPGIDVRSGGNTIKGNICHDNEDTGIQVYAYAVGVPSPDNLVVDNLSFDNGDHGIDINSAGSQRIVGNSVYKNVTTGINVEGPSSGTLLANNISVDNAINSLGTRGNIRVDATSITGTAIDYDAVFMSQSGQVQIVWGSTSYSTLAAFVGAIGQETHGQEADPKWAAPGSGDFHLTASSPGIDSANSGANGALDTDLENRPRVDDLAVADTGAGPRTYDDRGCYEYQPVSAVCGDGVKDSGEQCDGTALGGATCAAQGCSGGSPTCTSSCTISYATCTGCPVCGNGVKDAGEPCDGAALGGATCQTQGFYCATGSGLTCNANCTLNTAACIAGSCGDGSIQAACGETCDGTSLGGATCAAQGCAGGIPTCTSSCTVSYATCTGCPVCGNGIRDAGEQCDGSALGGATCQSLGFYCFRGRGLACNANCTFNTSACVVGSCDDGDACNGVETCNGSTGCVAGTPVTCTALDQCHVAGTCHAGVCNNPAKPDGTVCDDNDPATVNDTCQSGVCGGGGCGTKPRPKPSGYYRGLCNSGESRTYHDNSLTDGDAACVGSLTTTFHGISTVADLCAVFDNDGYGQSDTVRACDKGEIELMSLALNVCRHRVCLDQEIDSDCSGADDLTSVAASLATADAILSDPHRNKYTCRDARCLASEVNTGRGLPE